MPEAAQIGCKNLPEIHAPSEPYCCLLTNRFKATKWVVCLGVSSVSKPFELVVGGCLIALTICAGLLTYFWSYPRYLELNSRNEPSAIRTEMDSGDLKRWEAECKLRPRAEPRGSFDALERNLCELMFGKR